MAVGGEKRERESVKVKRGRTEVSRMCTVREQGGYVRGVGWKKGKNACSEREGKGGHQSTETHEEKGGGNGPLINGTMHGRLPNIAIAAWSVCHGAGSACSHVLVRL